MGRVGSCFDNAVSEAFNSVLKVEYVHRHTFATRTEARIRIATWITDFYNSRRLHSVCGFKSPIDHEHDYWAMTARPLADTSCDRPTAKTAACQPRDITPARSVTRLPPQPSLGRPSRSDHPWL
jgi:hypothetical protein